MTTRHDPPRITDADIDGDFLSPGLPWDRLMDEAEGVYDNLEQFRQIVNNLTRRHDPRNIIKVNIPLFTDGSGLLAGGLGIYGPTVPEGEYWIVESAFCGISNNPWSGAVFRNTDGTNTLGMGTVTGMVMNIVADFNFTTTQFNTFRYGQGISNSAILEPGDRIFVNDFGFSHGNNQSYIFNLNIRRERA